MPAVHVESAEPETLMTIGNDPIWVSPELTAEVTQMIDYPETPFSGTTHEYDPTNTAFLATVVLNPEA